MITIDLDTLASGISTRSISRSGLPSARGVLGPSTFLCIKRMAPRLVHIRATSRWTRWSGVAVFTGSFKDPYGIAINAAIVSIPSHKFCNRRFSFDAC